jgi:GNAT superfamily N-acetyltransferase
MRRAVSDLDLGLAVYRNFREMWEAVGALGQADSAFEVVRLPDMVLVKSRVLHRVPHMVLVSQVTHADAQAWAAALVRDVLPEPGSVLVSVPPGSEGSALTYALEHEGFALREPAPVAMALVASPLAMPVDDVDVSLVEHEPDLSLARDLLSRVFGLPAEVIAFYTPPHVVRTYLLRYEGTAVAAACMCPLAGSAGIHSVGVLPRARGNGYARRIIRYALGDAAAEGLGRAVLTCDPSVAPLYQRLGFTICWQTTSYWMEGWWRHG